MGSKLVSSENEAVERSFGVRFLGGGTSYVQTPGELYIRGKSKGTRTFVLLKSLCGELCKF